MPTPRVVRRRRAIKAGMGLLAVSLMTIAIVRVYMLSHARSPERTAGMTDQETAILKLVNDERSRAGLNPLKFSPKLSVVARGHSYDMALRDYFSRLSPEGIGPIDRLRGESIQFVEVSEIIFRDDSRDLAGLAERTVKTWLEKAETRAAILSEKLIATGVGVSHSEDGKTYVTQDFIR